MGEVNHQPAALVTGSTAGIGRAIALELAGLGYNIILSGRRPEEEVTGLISEIKEKNKRPQGCLYVRGDISTEEARKSLLEGIAEYAGYLTVLVNNAGISSKGRKDILDLEEEDMAHLLKVNLVAPFILTRDAVSLLRGSKLPAYIINISSISAYTVSTNRADYCISKAGMSMMTQQFAARLAGDGIGVFEIRPGIIKTDMTKEVTEKYDRLIEEGLLPVKRWGLPQDIARAVSGIVQGYLPYSTGDILNIDGGFHLRRL